MPLVKRQKTKMFMTVGISIKLSALHPRYQRAQVARMHEELYGKVFTLLN
jgi:proline dehydrogenase